MLRVLLLLNALLVSFTLAAEPKILTGKVTKVITGDLVQFSDEGEKEYTVRLEGIDAPEASQNFGSRSTIELTKLLALTDNKVEISFEVKDRDGNLLGTIYPHPKKENNISLNKMLVEFGYAWAYRKYSSAYIKEEEAARKDRLGLWSNTNPVAPWEWRKKKK